MKLAAPLYAGTLIRRYKRFLADVELADGRRLTVHCANPGAMTSCAEPGRPIYVSDSGNPRRKLRYSLEMIRMGRTWVGVNTARVNGTVARLIAGRRIPELDGYRRCRAEVRHGDSRIDFRLEDHAGDQPACWLEVKNATYRLGAHAAFPDAVTERGRKHLHALSSLAAAGARAVLFFHVGRADVRRLRPADEVDPAYGAALRAAVAAGVEPLAYRLRFNRRGVTLDRRLPIDL